MLTITNFTLDSTTSLYRQLFLNFILLLNLKNDNGKFGISNIDNRIMKEVITKMAINRKFFS